MLVSRGWIQAVALVVLFGFFVLGFLAYRTYTGQPPIPAERVVDPEGNLVFIGEDITVGQEVFLRNGIMEYGSIFGHGAYLAGIAALILAAELVRNHAPAEIIVLGTTLAATFVVARHMHKVFCTSPANFPAPVLPSPTKPLRIGYKKSKEVER